MGWNLIPLDESCMQKIITFLWFNGEAEAAVDFWVSVFRDAKKGAVRHYAESFPDPKWRGKVITASFTLRGQEFVALNAGPDFQFTPAVSFMVLCATQEEIDEYWAKLTDGGKTMACGWLTDKFGMTWQITPETLDGMLNDPDPATAARVMQAMMGMVKLDIAALERARDGKA
jgi:predicted 3-demethylubiquinone-9 3-methyltransferase (glyoxalase superfamily)